MTAIQGIYYDGKTSRGITCALTVYHGGEVRLEGAGEALSLADLRMSSRIGNTPRWVYLPDGGKFETTDNDAIDALLARLGIAQGARFLHMLETKKAYIAAAVILVVFSSWTFVRFGIPMLAKTAAFALPVKTNVAISKGALEILDKSAFSRSTLDSATQAHFRTMFARMVAAEPAQFNYRLVFRKGNKVGANAMALPSGTIIVTDEMVRLTRNDAELKAVLAHEIGHVVYRHGLRRAIQDSMVALAAVMITGDVSSTSSLIAALPTLLVSARYSQAFEREADAYSLAYLRAHKINPVNFKNLILRLEAERGGRTRIPRYLSSHPPTAERIRMFDGTPPSDAESLPLSRD